MDALKKRTMQDSEGGEQKGSEIWKMKRDNFQNSMKKSLTLFVMRLQRNTKYWQFPIDYCINNFLSATA